MRTVVCNQQTIKQSKQCIEYSTKAPTPPIPDDHNKSSLSCIQQTVQDLSKPHIPNMNEIAASNLL